MRRLAAWLLAVSVALACDGVPPTGVEAAAPSFSSAGNRCFGVDFSTHVARVFPNVFEGIVSGDIEGTAPPTRLRV